MGLRERLGVSCVRCCTPWWLKALLQKPTDAGYRPTSRNKVNISWLACCPAFQHRLHNVTRDEVCVDRVQHEVSRVGNHWHGTSNFRHVLCLTSGAARVGDVCSIQPCKNT